MASSKYRTPPRSPSAEVNQFKNRRVTIQDDTRIIGLWHFDEKAGVTASDCSGHGHNPKCRS